MARVLIVEDEEPLSLLLRYNLEAEGYEVETCGRGDDADTRLRESAPEFFKQFVVERPVTQSTRQPRAGAFSSRWDRWR